MKHTAIFFALALSLNLQAADTGIIDTKDLVVGEIARLDQLIEATEQSLEGQKRLRERIEQYRELQVSYLSNSDDNELLFQLIKSAYTILESIKAQHLETAFEPEFLSELSVLSRPAVKSGLPKP